jgi:broad specificity phosphatase PhoE
MARRFQLAMMAAFLALAACRSRQPEVPAMPPAAGPPANAAQLAAALRQGGLVLFLRHAATDQGRDDAAHVVLEDCATQRNLSALGRAQAESIGAAVRRLHLPIGMVRASPYCRAAETARLAFGHVLLDDDLLPATAPNAKIHLAGVRRQLGTPPVPRQNAVLVGHGDTIKALLNLDLDEGETLVVRPAPSGGSFAPVGRIRAEQWAAMQ